MNKLKKPENQPKQKHHPMRAALIRQRFLSPRICSLANSRTLSLPLRVVSHVSVPAVASFHSLDLSFMTSSGKPMPLQRHINARSPHPTYDDNNIKRYPVPDDKISWSTEFPEYSPPDFTHPSVLRTPRPPYADPADPTKVDWSKRKSLEYDRQKRKMEFDSDGRPLHPIGRTGLRGRGRLGKWGPNQAADLIVARSTDDKDVFEFVCICRSDTGIWALPGGMVDSTESSQQAAIREFFEEASSKSTVKAALTETIADEMTVEYEGVVDDSRSTDNAWTESTVCLFMHNATRDGELELTHDDDATDARWMRTDDPIFDDPKQFHGHHSMLIRAGLGLPQKTKRGK